MVGCIFHLGRYRVNMVSMSDQDKTVLTRKGKRGPAPTGKGELVGVRVQPDLLAALDLAIVQQNEMRSRPEMIRAIMAEWLQEKGYIDK